MATMKEESKSDTPTEKTSGTTWTNNFSAEPEGLFGCHNDPCTCASVFFCGCITASQLYERVMGEKGTCIKFTVVLFGLLLLGWVFQTIHVSISSNPLIPSIWGGPVSYTHLTLPTTPYV